MRPPLLGSSSRKGDLKARTGSSGIRARGQSALQLFGKDADHFHAQPRARRFNIEILRQSFSSITNEQRSLAGLALIGHCYFAGAVLGGVCDKLVHQKADRLHQRARDFSVVAMNFDG